MKPRVWIDKLVFNDKTILDIQKNDIVVFVGPNNAGKSASLKEMVAFLEKGTDEGKKMSKGKIFKNVDFKKDGNANDLILHVKSGSILVYRDHIDTFKYKGLNYEVADYKIERVWENLNSEGLNSIFSLFVNILTTEQRLIAANPPKNINIMSEIPEHPIHLIQKDEKLEKNFSDYFKQAFGSDLIVHKLAGYEVPLLVGERPVPEVGEDRLSTKYLEKLNRLDLLQEQGDGMRSFVGVLLNAFISYHTMVFIDEPEAFLHPPQARLLGKMLAKESPQDRQMFLATHSEDFLKGLIDGDTSRLKIIRIQRDGSFNKVNSLNHIDIKNVWNDSLLRHSNILNGLFHKKVVVCESDSDCRFYSAILFSQFEDSEQATPDVLFVHCSGKHRIPTVVKALKKLNVSTAVITDFDLLNNENPLKDIWQEFGGNWDSIKKDWNIVKTQIDTKRPELSTLQLKSALDNILKDVTQETISNDKIKEIEKLLKRTSPWSGAKTVGKAFIPNGDATQAFERLQTQLKSKGLFILEVGELESFCKSIGGHGPKWVSDVLEKDLRNDPELEIAREFVMQLIKD